MESREEKAKRLEILRNAMILNHLTDIDFNSEDEISAAYEKLLFKTIKEGSFDNIFLSKYLDELSEEERIKVLQLARNYSSLCFYRGDMDYWLDSVEGVTNSEPDIVVQLLLSNYNYLIRLAKNGGEEVLKFLDKFKGNDLFEDGSVIGLLINRFWGDLDTLETVLIDMAKEDGKYKDFTETQKIIMCDSPDGLLIRKQDDATTEFISSSELKKTISNEYIGEDNYPIKDINSDEFQKIVRSINSDCLKGTVYKK